MTQMMQHIWPDLGYTSQKSALVVTDYSLHGNSQVFQQVSYHFHLCFQAICVVVQQTHRMQADSAQCVSEDVQRRFPFLRLYSVNCQHYPPVCQNFLTIGFQLRPLRTLEQNFVLPHVIRHPPFTDGNATALECLVNFSQRTMLAKPLLTNEDDHIQSIGVILEGQSIGHYRTIDLIRLRASCLSIDTPIAPISHSGNFFQRYDNFAPYWVTAFQFSPTMGLTITHKWGRASPEAESMVD